MEGYKVGYFTSFLLGKVIGINQFLSIEGPTSNWIKKGKPRFGSPIIIFISLLSPQPSFSNRRI